MTTIRFADDPCPDETSIARIREPLRAFNESVLGNCGQTPLLVTATTDAGVLAGGVYGWIQFGWLYIHLLWVHEAHRRNTIGTRLMERIEALARHRGIRRARLATSDVQPGFQLYQRRGYTVFAAIPLSTDTGEHSEYLMWKDPI
jgi:GNAT superfamily N-acetyltransferase